MDELSTRWGDVLSLLEPEDRRVVQDELESKTRDEQAAMLQEVYDSIRDGKLELSSAALAARSPPSAQASSKHGGSPPGRRSSLGLTTLPTASSKFSDAKWQEAWRLIDLSDLRDHPLWLMELHDVLFSAFHELHSIFTFYCKSIAGAETARDAELMDMHEWLVFIRDCKVASKSFNRGLAENVFVTATSHVHRPTSLEDADRQMAFYEFVEAICRCAHLRENYSSLRRHVPLPSCVEAMLDECILPNAKRDTSLAVREMIENDRGIGKAFEVYGGALRGLHNQLVGVRHTHESTGQPTISMEQYIELLHARGVLGDVNVRQLSEVRVPKHTLKMYRATLTVAKAKRSFVESQRAEERQAGMLASNDLVTELDFGEFLECLARCGLLKYEQIEQMQPADRVTALILNVLGRMDVASVVTAATLVRAKSTFDARRDSQPLPGQTESEHAKWLECWMLLDLSDLPEHPEFLEELHEVLHGAYPELRLIFPFYCKSIAGAETARDAELMDMHEWLSFIRDCKVASKSFNRGLAENVFVTATSHVHRPTSLEDADRQMAFYEFVEAICRCAHLRENYSSLKRHVPLPICVRNMLDECVLPHAERDGSMEVRALIENDRGIGKAFEVYGGALRGLHNQLVGVRHTHESTGQPTISMEQYIELLHARGALGDVNVRQLSEVRVPKHTLKMYRATLTVAKAKRSFVESQRVEERQAGMVASNDLVTELDFGEFLECVARCGLLKYEQIEQMQPADRVTALILNVLGRMDVASVVTAATLVRAKSTFDARRDSQPLPGQTESEHAKWLECWMLLDLSDLPEHPEFLEELHEVLHGAYPELRLIFPFYCKSIAGAETARDAELMDMHEWLSFIRDCKVASKSFNRGLAENVFVTATSHVHRPTSLEDADRQMAFYEFVEAICRCAHLRENYSSLRRHVPLPICVRNMLDECVLPHAERDGSMEVRALIENDRGIGKAFEVYGGALRGLHNQLVGVRHTHESTGQPTISMEQYIELLHARGALGDVNVRQLSEVRVPKHTLKMYRATLTVAKAKRSFVESQRVEERQAGMVASNDLVTELDFGEFLECLARCGLLKYEQIEQMQPADRVTALILNVLGRMDVASVIEAATLVRAGTTFNARTDSERLPGESPAEHDKWLKMWLMVEAGLADLHGFPLWLRDVHDMLHAGLHDLGESYKTLSTQGGAEFGLDFAVWDRFVQSKATRVPGALDAPDLSDTSQLIFNACTTSIAGLPRLTFGGFLTALPRLAFSLANPRFGDRGRQNLDGTYVPVRVQPVQWALVSLLDAMDVRAARGGAIPTSRMSGSKSPRPLKSPGARAAAEGTSARSPSSPAAAGVRKAWSAERGPRSASRHAHSDGFGGRGPSSASPARQGQRVLVTP